MKKIFLIICIILFLEIATSTKSGNIICGNLTISYEQKANNPNISFKAVMNPSGMTKYWFAFGLGRSMYPADVIVCHSLNQTCFDGFISGAAQADNFPGPVKDSNTSALSNGPSSVPANFRENLYNIDYQKNKPVTDQFTYTFSRPAISPDKKWDYDYRAGKLPFICAYGIDVDYPTKRHDYHEKKSVTFDLYTPALSDSSDGKGKGVLQFNSDFKVDYNINGDVIEMTATLSGSDKGWVAWGHGKTMYPADVIFCGTENNNLMCWDGYVSGFKDSVNTALFPQPFKDDQVLSAGKPLLSKGSADLTFISGTAIDNNVVYKVSRKLTTNDVKWDQPYRKGINEMIWAYHKTNSYPTTVHEAKGVGNYTINYKNGFKLLISSFALLIISLFIF